LDPHPLSQAFRLPGFKNKLGRWVKVWKIGPEYSIDFLAKWANVQLQRGEKREMARKSSSKKDKKISYIPNAHPKLYDWALDLLYSSQPAYRYTSMLATVVCA